MYGGSPSQMIDSERPKRILMFAASTLVLAGLVYFAGVEKIIDAALQADPVLFSIAVAIGSLPVLVFTFTWFRVLRKVGIDVDYRETFSLWMAGGFLNSVTPLGNAGGEPFMAYVVSRAQDVEYEKAFSAILSADLINIFPPMTFVAGGLVYVAFFGSVNSLLVQVAYLVGLALVLGSGLLYLLWYNSDALGSFLSRAIRGVTDRSARLEKYGEKAEEKIDGMTEALSRVGDDPVYLVKTAVIVHATFVFEVMALALVLASLGVETDLTPLYFVLPLADLGNNLPVPGGAGAYEGAMTASLTLFVPGISVATAVTAAVLYRMIVYWFRVPFQYAFFNRVDV
jgi:conserved hypothetical protein